ncbi:helix-turn-helix transcriptional regulator [Olivibacter sp. SDN3]|uniref:helix-turn-helix transcriptional regulator n=1 Tax=Olivibacter sp. SDN3 TaxID=2764720 RepID=UPI0016512401|nr:AraC family transcriptional regulator [Olivibacter sp. SDN3]QNL47848.1 helix-turn-helix transcriptional regulator [Olivibacter sp. SDN3]
MDILHTGEFFGQTNETLRFNGLTLTDTEYTHEYVDWHYHENAYFTFILQGNVIEGNRKEVYHCSPGNLIFHHWQEAHYNIKPKGFTRGFHIELTPEWFAHCSLDKNMLQGSIHLKHPALTTLMYNIVKETKLDGKGAQLAVDSLLAALFTTATGTGKPQKNTKPLWVKQLRELLHDAPMDQQWTLSALSQYLNLHPVHLSRDFPKYFNCGLGDYLRTLKVQRALNLFADEQLSLTTIALQSGFADQSHFIRSFKALHHITPLAYRKLLT